MVSIIVCNGGCAIQETPGPLRTPPRLWGKKPSSWKGMRIKPGCLYVWALSLRASHELAMVAGLG